LAIPGLKYNGLHRKAPSGSLRDLTGLMHWDFNEDVSTMGSIYCDQNVVPHSGHSLSDG
jgi:hypothetical protein